MPNPSEARTDRERRAMVAEQLRNRGITDERVLAAMGTVPREAFLEPADRPFAYRDAAISIPEGQTMSHPWIVARMTELLRAAPGDRILEIGTGSGYQAAILATIGARVRTIERHARLAEAARRHLADLGVAGVDVRVGDGSRGAPEAAPWDGIIVTAAAPVVPPSLPDQLAIGARLVIPVGNRGTQQLVVVERRGQDDWTTVSDVAVVFVPLIGAEGFER